VNNAGIIYRKSILETPVEQWDETQATNLRAPFLLAQTVARGMIKQRLGLGFTMGTPVDSTLPILGDQGVSLPERFCAATQNPRKSLRLGHAERPPFCESRRLARPTFSYVLRRTNFVPRTRTFCENRARLNDGRQNRLKVRASNERFFKTEQVASPRPSHA
jgi:hypothetical protein